LRDPERAIEHDKYKGVIDEQILKDYQCERRNVKGNINEC